MEYLSRNMKRVTFCISFLFITSSLLAQVMDDLSLFNGDYDKAFIKKHKIRQVIIRTAVHKYKPTVVLFEFDKNGFLEKESISDSLNRKISDYWFKYNEYGDLIERRNYNYELDKSYTDSFTNTYQGGLLVSNKWSLMPYSVNYTYYPDGKLKQSVTSSGFDSYNNNKGFKFYNYDSLGVLQSIHEAVEISPGNLNIIEKTEFVRDTKGRIIAINKLVGYDSVITYNKKGFIKTRRLKLGEDFGNAETLDEYEYYFWK